MSPDSKRSRSPTTRSATCMDLTSPSRRTRTYKSAHTSSRSSVICSWNIADFCSSWGRVAYSILVQPCSTPLKKRRVRAIRTVKTKKKCMSCNLRKGLSDRDVALFFGQLAELLVSLIVCCGRHQHNDHHSRQNCCAIYPAGPLPSVDDRPES